MLGKWQFARWKGKGEGGDVEYVLVNEGGVGGCFFFFFFSFILGKTSGDRKVNLGGFILGGVVGGCLGIRLGRVEIVLLDSMYFLRL